MSSYLPDHLVEKILSNLPPKSLLRFRCVCKSWRDLICDPFFIQIHSIRSAQRQPIQYYLWNWDSDVISTFHVEENPENCLVEFYNHVPRGDPYISYLGSCDAFVFILHEDRKTVKVLNPSTKTHVLVTQETDIRNLSPTTIFYDPTSCCYKMLAFAEVEDNYYSSEAMVFTFGKNTWENIGNIPYSVLPGHSGSGVLFSEELHFIAETESGKTVIVAFNLMEGNFKEIALPEEVDNNLNFVLNVTIWESCLCIVRAYETKSIVVWSMKEYGNKDSWIKLLIIECSSMESGIVGDIFYALPLHMTKQGYIIFDVFLTYDYDSSSIMSHYLFFYNEKNNYVMAIELKDRDPHTGMTRDFSFNFFVITHTESLSPVETMFVKE